MTVLAYRMDWGIGLPNIMPLLVLKCTFFTITMITNYEMDCFKKLKKKENVLVLKKKY